MEISEIKQRLSIQTVLNYYNLHPDKHHFVKCPFHGDEDPSLKIYPETNTFNCFGCGAAGDVIEFIERYERKGKHEAILKAKSMIDPSADIIQKTMIQTSEPEHDKDLLPRLAVIGKLMQESRGSFKRTAAAKEYLRSRGLDPDKTQAGYMGGDLGKGWNEKLQQSAIDLPALQIENSRNNREILGSPLKTATTGCRNYLNFGLDKFSFRPPAVKVGALRVPGRNFFIFI